MRRRGLVERRPEWEVLYDGRVLGAINMLHEEHWYRPEDTSRADPFAALLAPALL